MQKFKFRLAPVQNLREHAEREQKDVLAKEQYTLHLLEEKREQLQGACRKWSAHYLKICSIGAVPADMIRIQTYLTELRWRLKENTACIHTQTAAVEQARQLLLEKMQERKTIDALFDKQFQAYRYQQKIQAEKEIEEQISARIGR